MAKLEPLSAQERDFAAEHHSLIYKFLHTNKYSIDEMYGVAVFGYLKGVQVYLNRQDLKAKYAFTVIAWYYMRAEMENHYNRSNALKRMPPGGILSLDAINTSTEDFYNLVSDGTMEDAVVEAEVIERLIQCFPQIQRNILKCKLDGMNNREICKELGILDGKFYREMNKIKATAERLIGRRKDK